MNLASAAVHGSLTLSARALATAAASPCACAAFAAGAGAVAMFWLDRLLQAVIAIAASRPVVERRRLVRVRPIMVLGAAGTGTVWCALAKNKCRVAEGSALRTRPGGAGRERPGQKSLSMVQRQL